MTESPRNPPPPAPSAALQTSTRANGRGALLTIFLIVFIDLVGFGIVLPNLQLYGLTFGISNYFALALIGTTYSLLQFVFSPLLGRWSDRIGRRPVLLVSQAGTLAGCAILFVAHYFTGAHAAIGIALLYGSRVVQGVCGGNISTASAYIADITPPEKRAKGMGLIGAAFGIGFIFGPVIGGTVGGHWGLAYVPVAAAVFSAAALVMTFFYLPESLKAGTAPDTSRRFSLLGLRHAMARPAIRALILMFFMNGFAFAAMEQTLSLFIKYKVYDQRSSIYQVHGAAAPGTTATHSVAATSPAAPEDVDTVARMASRSSGYLYGFIGIIIALIQGGMIHRLTRRFGEPRLVITGPVLIAIGLVLVTVSLGASPWTGLAVGCALLAIGSSLFNPSVQALISRHAAPTEQGEVMGANQGMASLARALGPVLAGLLYEYVSPETPYYVAAGLTFAVALWAMANQHRLRPPPVVAFEDEGYPPAASSDPSEM